MGVRIRVMRGSASIVWRCSPNTFPGIYVVRIDKVLCVDRDVSSVYTRDQSIRLLFFLSTRRGDTQGKKKKNPPSSLVRNRSISSLKVFSWGLRELTLSFQLE